MGLSDPQLPGQTFGTIITRNEDKLGIRKIRQVMIQHKFKKKVWWQKKSWQKCIFQEKIFCHWSILSTFFLGIKSYITWCTCSLYASPGGGPGAAVVPRDQNMLRFTLGYARCYNPHSNLYMLLVLEHVTFVAIGHGILAYCKAAFYVLQGVPLFEYL